MFLLSLSVREIIEDKGLQVKDAHLEELEIRWKNICDLKGNLENAQIDEADIGMRNIPGGDHIE